MADKNIDVLDDKDAVRAENKPSPVTVDGLNPNTTYKGWKTRYNGETDTTPLDDFSTAIDVPGAPTLALTPGDGKLLFVLTAPTSDGAPSNGKNDITSYTIRYSMDGGKTFTDQKVADPTKLSGEIDGLTNGTEVQVKAIATNSTGDSPESAIVKATPASASPKVDAVTTDNHSVTITAH